ncbi:lipopolysaccharide biosynthesis protein [Actinomycetospora termitidis]|uniref:lipopolysaccharide biosynthesis protein n=1 Tax=Actinomycetospora termitidis TaxID=3053470 RepID=UPI003CE5C641
MHQSDFAQEEPSRLRVLLQRVVGIALSTVAAQALTGLVFVVAARNLSPGEFGVTAVLISIGAISAVFLDGGLNLSHVKEISAGARSVGKSQDLNRAKRPMVLAAACVEGFVLFLLQFPWPLILVFVLQLWFLWESQSANALLRAKELFRRSAVGQIAGRLAGLVSTLIFGSLLFRAEYLLVALAIGYLTEAILDRVLLPRDCKKTKVEPTSLRALASTHRASLSYGMTSLSASTQQLDTPMVAAGAGAVEAGVYAAAGRLIGPLNFAGAALAMVALPWLSREQSDEDRRHLEERRVVRLAVFLALLPLAAGAVGYLALPYILGAEYAGSGATFSVLACGAAVSTLNQAPATALQARGRQRVVAFSVAIGLSVGVLGTLAFAYLGGAVLAAFALLVSQTLILFALALQLRASRARER